MVSKGNLIDNDDFNTNSLRVASILGKGAGQTGYGQRATSAETTLANGATIDKSNWNLMIGDINTCSTHQSGNSALPFTFATGDIVGADESGTSVTRVGGNGSGVNNASFSPASSPILYLDNQANGSVDISGNQTTTVSAPDITTDSPHVYTFDAQTDEITYQPANNFIVLSRLAGAFSVWFKTNANYGASGKANYTGRGTILGGGLGFVDSLWVQNAPPYRIFGETTTNNEEYVDVASAIPGDTWVNLIVTCSSGTATSYLNGSQIDQKTITGDLRFRTLSEAANLFGNIDFEGEIGPVQMWNRALTTTEITDNYQYFLPRFTQGNVFEIDNPDTSKGVNDVLNGITTIETNSSNSSGASFTTTSTKNFGSTDRVSAWNGNIYGELDVIFDATYTTTDTNGSTTALSGTTDDHRRHFFNTGGDIRITVGFDSPVSSKDSRWAEMFTNMGTVILGKNATTCTGTGNAADGVTDVNGNGSTDPAVGNYQLTAGYKLIFKRFAASGPYQENFIEISAKKVGDNTIRIRVLLNDVDTGDPLDDENVQQAGGTISAGLDLKRATGSNISIPEPTFGEQFSFQSN